MSRCSPYEIHGSSEVARVTVLCCVHREVCLLRRHHCERIPPVNVVYRCHVFSQIKVSQSLPARDDLLRLDNRVSRRLRLIAIAAVCVQSSTYGLQSNHACQTTGSAVRSLKHLQCASIQMFWAMRFSPSKVIGTASHRQQIIFRPVDIV